MIYALVMSSAGWAGYGDLDDGGKLEGGRSSASSCITSR
jgi:hypothetical protein